MVKVRTDDTESADTNGPSADKTELKCGHPDVRQTINHSLNQEPDHPAGDRVKEVTMNKHDEKHGTKLSFAQIEELAKNLRIYRASTDSEESFRERTLDAWRDRARESEAQAVSHE